METSLTAGSTADADERNRTNGNDGSSGPRCAGCRFWQAIAVDAKYEQPKGFCRRYAPRPGDNDYVHERWPQTAATDFCGEFEETILNADSKPGERSLAQRGQCAEAQRESGSDVENVDEWVALLVAPSARHPVAFVCQPEVKQAIERELCRKFGDESWLTSPFRFPIYAEAQREPCLVFYDERLLQLHLRRALDGSGGKSGAL